MSDFDCAVCGAANIEPGVACRECKVSAEWQDLLRASEFASRECEDLCAHDLLSDLELQQASKSLAAMRLLWASLAKQNASLPADTGLRTPTQCRQCGRPFGAAHQFCVICGSPTGSHADHLRYLDFTSTFIVKQFTSDWPAETIRRCVDVIGVRSESVAAELKREIAALSAATQPELQGKPRRTLIEILLEPRNIRWLLGSGGVLLAVGLVIFLSSLGVFKNAMVVASAMAMGTLATLAGGIWIIRRTRHSLAGTAVALLGCLVMPLNLWFYNANHLVTLDGHLWVAAMICCGLYAAVAFVLEDPTFVYVLFGGIAMTGMLVLADVHRIAEISAPVTLLVSLGFISLHAERAFADDGGPFSRKRFGLACFWSAHALIGLGLVLLLGSQVAAWLPTFGVNFIDAAALSSNQYLQLALVVVGAYAYLYSSLVVRHRGIYSYLGVACLLWAELLGIHIGHLTHRLPVLLSVMAITSLAMNIAAALLARKSADSRSAVADPLAAIGIGLAGIALAIGSVPYLNTALGGIIAISHFELTWGSIGAVVLIAVCSRVAAALNTRRSEHLAVGYLFIAAAAVFVTLASLLSHLGVAAWPTELTTLMIIPMIYLVASRFYADGPTKRALPIIAGAATTLLMFSGLVAHASQWFNPVAGQTTDLWLAAFSMEVALFFAICAAMNRGKHHVYLAAAILCEVLYQLLGFWQLPLQSCNIAIALAGFTGLVGYRLIGEESRRTDPRAKALFVCANGLASLPMAGIVLMSLSRLASGHTDLSMLWTPAILSLIALLAAAFVPAGGIRRWYLSLMITQLAVELITLEQYSTLGLPRKLEVLSVLAGLVLLVTGYGIWFRDQDSKSEGVGFCLLFGALLAGLPPAIFAVVNRFGYEISFVDELSLVTIAVLMFLTGMMSRVRATTLIGGALLACHLVTLVVFAGMKAQLAVGAYVAIGGAALFGTGLLLSVYRDRLITMPERIKHRQGLFRVLSWN